jgi:hypothetical protein
MWSKFPANFIADGALIFVQSNDNGFGFWLVLLFLVIWGGLVLALIGSALSDYFKLLFIRNQRK